MTLSLNWKQLTQFRGPRQEKNEEQGPSLSSSLSDQRVILKGRELHLSGAGLTSLDKIPPSLAEQLTTLYLGNNYLSSCEGIQQFIRLSNLSIANNNIRYFKELDQLSACSHLEKLTISGNPVSFMPFFKDYLLGICPRLQRIDNVEVSNRDVAERSSKFLKLKNFQEQMKTNLLRMLLLDHLLKLLACNTELKKRNIRLRPVKGLEGALSSHCIGSILRACLFGGVYRKVAMLCGEYLERGVQELTMKATILLQRKGDALREQLFGFCQQEISGLLASLNQQFPAKQQVCANSDADTGSALELITLEAHPTDFSRSCRAVCGLSTEICESRRSIAVEGLTAERPRTSLSGSAVVEPARPIKTTRFKPEAIAEVQSKYDEILRRPLAEVANAKEKEKPKKRLPSNRASASMSNHSNTLSQLLPPQQQESEDGLGSDADTATHVKKQPSRRIILETVKVHRGSEPSKKPTTPSENILSEKIASFVRRSQEAPDPSTLFDEWLQSWEQRLLSMSCLSEQDGDSHLMSNLKNCLRSLNETEEGSHIKFPESGAPLPPFTSSTKVTSMHALKCRIDELTAEAALRQRAEAYTLHQNEAAWSICNAVLQSLEHELIEGRSQAQQKKSEVLKDLAELVEAKEWLASDKITSIFARFEALTSELQSLRGRLEDVKRETDQIHESSEVHRQEMLDRRQSLLQVKADLQLTEQYFRHPQSIPDDPHQNLPTRMCWECWERERRLREWLAAKRTSQLTVCWGLLRRRVRRQQKIRRFWRNCQQRRNQELLFTYVCAWRGVVETARKGFSLVRRRRRTEMNRRWREWRETLKRCQVRERQMHVMCRSEKLRFLHKWREFVGYRILKATRRRLEDQERAVTFCGEAFVAWRRLVVGCRQLQGDAELTAIQAGLLHRKRRILLQWRSVLYEQHSRDLANMLEVHELQRRGSELALKQTVFRFWLHLASADNFCRVWKCAVGLKRLRQLGHEHRRQRLEQSAAAGHFVRRRCRVCLWWLRRQSRRGRQARAAERVLQLRVSSKLLHSTWTSWVGLASAIWRNRVSLERATLQYFSALQRKTFYAWNKVCRREESLSERAVEPKLKRHSDRPTALSPHTLKSLSKRDNPYFRVTGDVLEASDGESSVASDIELPLTNHWKLRRSLGMLRKSALRRVFLRKTFIFCRRSSLLHTARRTFEAMWRRMLKRCQRSKLEYKKCFERSEEVVGQGGAERKVKLEKSFEKLRATAVDLRQRVDFVEATVKGSDEEMAALRQAAADVSASLSLLLQSNETLSSNAKSCQDRIGFIKSLVDGSVASQQTEEAPPGVTTAFTSLKAKIERLRSEKFEMFSDVEGVYEQSVFRQQSVESLRLRIQLAVRRAEEQLVLAEQSRDHLDAVIRELTKRRAETESSLVTLGSTITSSLEGIGAENDELSELEAGLLNDVASEKSRHERLRSEEKLVTEETVRCRQLLREFSVQNKIFSASEEASREACCAAAHSLALTRSASDRLLLSEEKASTPGGSLSALERKILSPHAGNGSRLATTKASLSRHRQPVEQPPISHPYVAEDDSIESVCSRIRSRLSTAPIA